MKVIHHNDRDGRCAAFLVAREFRDSLHKEDMIEVDHARPIPVEVIEKGELVFIVDFSFSGKLFDTFKEIINRAGYVVWIDHHADFLKMEKEHPWTAEIPGIRRVNIVSADKKRIKFSGAALTMIYMGMVHGLLYQSFSDDQNNSEKRFITLLLSGKVRKNKHFTDEEFTFEYHPYCFSDQLADMVEWVSDYDTFSRSHEKFEEFYYGISRINSDPYDGDWAHPISDILEAGSEIKKVMDLENEEYLKRNAMILTVKLKKVDSEQPTDDLDDDESEDDVETFQVLAVNKEGNSFVFNSVPDIEMNFPVRMIFRIQDNFQAKVTFFSSESLERPLARELAVQFGGGGHPNAAGCTILLSDWRYTFTMDERYEDWLKFHLADM